LLWQEVLLGRTCNLVNFVDGDDLQYEDGPIWDSGGEELDEASELDREWQRRHDQFHTVIR